MPFCRCFTAHQLGPRPGFFRLCLSEVAAGHSAHQVLEGWDLGNTGFLTLYLNEIDESGNERNGSLREYLLGPCLDVYNYITVNNTYLLPYLPSSPR